MNRVNMKENAKALLRKNHWLCVVAAFLTTIGAGASGGTGTFFQGFVEGHSSGDSQIPPFWEGSSDSLIVGLVIVGIAILFAVLGILLNLFVFNQFKVGGARFFLKYRRNMPVEINEIFQSYKDRTYLNIAKVTFIKNLIIGLWSLLCFIPGILKYYEYWATEYILSVRPDISYSEAMRLSQRIMNGHKLELFELQVSFIGWHILTMFTCGLVNIFYVSPYMLISFAEFYSYVRVEALRTGTATVFDLPDYDDYNNQNQFNPNSNYSNPSYNMNGYTAQQSGEYYNQSQYGQPQYNPPQYNQPQYGQTQYTQEPISNNVPNSGFMPKAEAFDSFANCMPQSNKTASQEATQINNFEVPTEEVKPEATKPLEEEKESPPIEEPATENKTEAPKGDAD